jgi:hypothetical protein
MDWHGFLLELQASGLSTWVRESPSLLGFPTILVIHTIGMGFLVGTCAAMDLRILGFARGIPIVSIEALVPVMRLGFWLNAISGLLLLLAYPIKNFSNPVFFLKLSLIAIALIDTWLILKHVVRKSREEQSAVSGGAKALAVVSLVLWTSAVVAGRLLFYTYKHVNSSGDPF